MTDNTTSSSAGKGTPLNPLDIDPEVINAAQILINVYYSELVDKGKGKLVITPEEAVEMGKPFHPADVGNDSDSGLSNIESVLIDASNGDGDGSDSETSDPEKLTKKAKANWKCLKVGVVEDDRLSFHTGVKVWIYPGKDKMDWHNKEHVRKANLWLRQNMRRANPKNRVKLTNKFVKEEEQWLAAFFEAERKEKEANGKHRMKKGVRVVKAFNDQFEGKVLDGHAGKRPKRNEYQLNAYCHRSVMIRRAKGLSDYPGHITKAKGLLTRKNTAKGEAQETEENSTSTQPQPKHAPSPRATVTTAEKAPEDFTEVAQAKLSTSNHTLVEYESNSDEEWAEQLKDFKSAPPTFHRTLTLKTPENLPVSGLTKVEFIRIYLELHNGGPHDDGQWYVQNNVYGKLLNELWDEYQKNAPNSDPAAVPEVPSSSDVLSATAVNLKPTSPKKRKHGGND
ncbi:hypothetical protein K432DRAFT_394839 [Lepidopterella palustris CBS 459.81]|uniref:Uncharacterized protein n=1 Tax=Lepidopterella palustris CBS 459.81 TaxID=1314670 RepID=A0A8E2JD87_9PEZI|nr:hypothetical protein K432DRAFT_394839 [Lepidopterella palustris CBS 459.81]